MGAEHTVQLRGPNVFVVEAAESVSSQDADVASRSIGQRALWCRLAQRGM